jgi:transcriptional regulator with XRE-family HTH domain
MARTPKAEALGRVMRQLREDAGLTLRDLSEVLGGVNHGTLSRYETGDRAPKPEELTRILMKLNVRDDKYDEIMTMAYDVLHSEWVAITLAEQRQQLTAFLDFERDSTTITSVSPFLVPGLLQISGYVEAIMSKTELPVAEQADRTRNRLKRKEILTREPWTPSYRAFIGIMALHQIVGSREIMAEQIRHLMEIAHLPNVDLRIIPFDTGWYSALEGAFDILEPTTMKPIVALANARSAQFLHESADVDLYRRAVDRVAEVALSTADSMRLMANVASRMEH